MITFVEFIFTRHLHIRRLGQKINYKRLILPSTAKAEKTMTA